MKRSYMVVYERIAPDNWGAWTVDILGAVGAGDTLEDARQSVREAITLQLNDLSERGLDAPQASSKAVDFSDIDPDPVTSHYEIEWITVDLPGISATANTSSAQAA